MRTTLARNRDMSVHLYVFTRCLFASLLSSTRTTVTKMERWCNGTVPIHVPAASGRRLRETPYVLLIAFPIFVLYEL